MNNEKKYLYDRFEFTEEYRQEVIELIRRNTNVEIGGYRIWDGLRTHLMQNPWELADFIFALKDYEKVNNFNFKCFLEVGFASGFNNTILHKFFQFKHIVGIDLFSSNLNGVNLLSNMMWKNLTLICGDSASESTLKKAKILGPYDLVFIDANHTYEYVKKDFENYSKLLSENGVIGFHDIDCPDWPGIKKYWNELKETGKYEMREFVCKGYALQYGIGMLWLK